MPLPPPPPSIRARPASRRSRARRPCWLLLTLLPALPAAAQNMLDCIAPEGIVGGACDSDASLRVELKNKCDVPVFVNLCIQVDGRDWQCWRENAAPGATLVHHTCWATRRYEYTACTDGVKECGFQN